MLEGGGSDMKVSAVGRICNFRRRNLVTRVITTEMYEIKDMLIVATDVNTSASCSGTR